jgi:hypothetical protein
VGGRLKELVHEKDSGVLFFVFEFMETNLYRCIRDCPEGMPTDRMRGIV